MSGEKQKTEGEILFPEEQVGRFTVRPWTLAQSVMLAPSIAGLVSIAKEAGAAEFILDLASKAPSGPQTELVESVAGKLMAMLPEIIPKILPYVPKILSVTLEESEEEIGKLDLGISTQLLLVIVTQNVEYLKNFFGPGMRRKPAIAG